MPPSLHRPSNPFPRTDPRGSFARHQARHRSCSFVVLPQCAIRWNCKRIGPFRRRWDSHFRSLSSEESWQFRPRHFCRPEVLRHLPKSKTVRGQLVRYDSNHFKLAGGGENLLSTFPMYDRDLWRRFYSNPTPSIAFCTYACWPPWGSHAEVPKRALCHLKRPRQFWLPKLWRLLDLPSEVCPQPLIETMDLRLIFSLFPINGIVLIYSTKLMVCN